MAASISILTGRRLFAATAAADGKDLTGATVAPVKPVPVALVRQEGRACDLQPLTHTGGTAGLNVSGKIFYRAVEDMKYFVQFDPSWANGTGYFDGACKCTMQPGDQAWSYDALTQRYLILIGTRFGVVVVFERYTHGTGLSPVIVCNVPRKGYSFWSLAGLNGQLGERVLGNVLGDELDPNIGERIEDMGELLASR